MNYGIILDPALQGMGRRSLNVRRFDPCKHSSRGIVRKIRARILTELKYLLTQLNFEQDRMLHTDDRPPINLSFRYIIMIFPSSDRTLADFGHSHNDSTCTKVRLRREKMLNNLSARKRLKNRMV